MTTRAESIPNAVATLNDAGREAGVSAMAASMVLNKPRSTTRISSETRERIPAAAAKLNYQPNLAAVPCQGGGRPHRTALREAVQSQIGQATKKGQLRAETK